MARSSDPVPTFNLWTDPWITLERSSGLPKQMGIEQALLNAHEHTAIYDSSPLVVVGIHRLLTAILHATLDPKKPFELQRLWQSRRFSADKIKAFGQQYVERFDLFSERQPFFQSADVPMQPDKGDKTKTVAYLVTEAAAGTGITHYRHGTEEDQVICPACSAHGLVIIPCFATSGGAGIRPSINGVPPIYILPGGKTLFESLAASLVTPDYQPQAASRKKDMAWWDRPAKVDRGKEVYEVGYLHSLTFPARRVRLHPERLNAVCTRCGRRSEWGVRTMIFEMGESRPKDAAFWFDPFVTYRLPDEKSDRTPIPIRPTAGKALWREFASLFLPQSQSEAKKQRVARPSVLYQMANERIGADMPALAFRCVGMRTDMKAKIFEWIDAGFEVPPSLLKDEEAGQVVRDAMQFASDCAGVMAATFREEFGESRKAERHKVLKERMLANYWATLAGPFRQFVMGIADAGQRAVEQRRWAETVLAEARRAFAEAAEAVGDDAISLRHQVKGRQRCNIRLAKKRNDYLQEGGTE